MLSNTYRVVAATLVAALLTSGIVMASDTKEDQALAVATQWLGLVDEQKYDESWESAASFFKQAVSQEQWGQAVSAAMAPFGALLSRELRSKQFTTSLPGAPDGEYVVIQFTATFENKASAVETITPMLDSDGQWRVAGYFVK
ncbi:MAG: DUF4019 domain-containing protein [Xanthomonadales bacterium]|jgi:hypothetical protein|nr:DUF4019 domain-containing protein [Xanthomonadales bacterium]